MEVEDFVKEINELCNKWAEAHTSYERTGKTEDRFYSDELSKQIFTKMFSAGFNSQFWTWADHGYV